jgi:hypothetical protein
MKYGILQESAIIGRYMGNSANGRRPRELWISVDENVSWPTTFGGSLRR